MRLEEINGTEIYRDIRLGHTWFEVGVLRTFLNEYIYTHTFVEIGIHEGGLSYLMLPEFAAYVGVELTCDIVRPEVVQLYNIHSGALLVCGDCFSDTFLEHVSAIKPKIIYCDGGYKAEEILHFKNACVPGDIILCHDFWDGKREVYDVDNVIPEVTINDIEPFEQDRSFICIDERIFKNTRIIGWQKI